MKQSILFQARAARACFVAGLWACGGCMSLGGWVNDYQAAEQRQRDSGKPILIFYKNHLDPLSGAMDRTLHQSPVEGAAAGRFVRCILLTDYDPDRVYVAQYDVTRAPALIVVHPDGTFHAREGLLSSDEMLAFLDGAKPPGQSPIVNPYVPRVADFHWTADLKEARASAAKQGKPLLILFKWWLGRDDWRMQRTLEAPEAYRLTADCVHCRLDYDHLPTRACMAELSIRQTPALVVERPDGTRQMLEGLVPTDDVVRFLQTALKPASSSVGSAAAAESGSTDAASAHGAQ